MNVNGHTHDGGLRWADPHLNDIDAEQQRLRAELAAANARLDAARRRLVEREEALNAALRQELDAVQREIAEMDEEHRIAVAEIHARAQAEIARIVRGGAEPPVGPSEWYQHG